MIKGMIVAAGLLTPVVIIAPAFAWEAPERDTRVFKGYVHVPRPVTVKYPWLARNAAAAITLQNGRNGVSDATGSGGGESGGDGAGAAE